MARTTLKQVNAELPEGIELVKGDGYFYFSGGDTMSWPTSSVYVYHLSELTVDEWVSAFNFYRTAAEAEKGI